MYDPRQLWSRLRLHSSVQELKWQPQRLLTWHKDPWLQSRSRAGGKQVVPSPKRKHLHFDEAFRDCRSLNWSCGRISIMFHCSYSLQKEMGRVTPVRIVRGAAVVEYSVNTERFFNLLLLTCKSERRLSPLTTDLVWFVTGLLISHLYWISCLLS